MPNIDVSTVLRRTVSTRYDDLVTRRTGQAVRIGIIQDLAESDDSEVAVIDFTNVRCIDFSCADEVVGKLLLEHGNVRYFLLRGITEMHQVAIEQILERYQLAVVGQDRNGQVQVLGAIPDHVRQAFHRVAESGSVGSAELAGDLDVPHDTAEHAIAELVQRRLAVKSPKDNRVTPLA